MTTASREPTAPSRALPLIERGTIVRGAVIVGLLLVALFGAPEIAGADWITTFTSIAIYSVAALGFSILYGRVGMISLGQVALLTIGCWIGARLSYGTSLPFPLLLLVAGGITCVIGTLVGLPALRLSGIYLALITLMFAGATTIVLAVTDFPSGGGGFTGRSATGALTTSTPPCEDRRSLRRTSPTTATPSSSAPSCSCSRCSTSPASRDAPGQRSARASRQPSPPASTSRSTSSGRSRSRPSSPVSRGACSPRRWEFRGRSRSRRRTR